MTSRLWLKFASSVWLTTTLSESELTLISEDGPVYRGRLARDLAETSTLETVATRDPTHIVANKLLVEAHLQNADAEKAGERLETYRLLNDRDPEIDHLEYRLEKLRADTEQEAATAVVGEPFELEEEPAAEEISAAEEEPAPAPADDPFQLAADVPSPDIDSLWSAPAAPEAPQQEEPFAGLVGLDADRHWQLIADEGIFASLGGEAPPGKPASAVEEPGAEEPVAEEPVAEEPAAV